MIKFLSLVASILIVVSHTFAQDGNFNNLTFNNLTKSGGINDYSGWGVNTGNLLDSRPNSPYGGAFIINQHQGLTFSAHSYYGGIRFYNQGYPGGPFDSASGAKMVMSINNGNVGIGTADPQYKLHIEDANPVIALTSTNPIDPSSAIRGNNSTWIMGWGGLGGQEDISIGTQDNTGSRTITLAAGGTARVKIIANGNVGIGTNTPKERLSVNGKIRAQEIKVETANWPDYVFNENYNPSSLSELEKYIKANKHLPEIPSAKEAEENGIGLGEMNAKLLKKVEELTLYIIEQNKKAEEKDKRIEKLTSLIRLQDKRLTKLENE